MGDVMSECIADKLVFIASSTGGPKALQQLLPFLDKNLDAPVVVVQHMPRGFTEMLAKRLDELSQIRVCEAKDGMYLQKKCVYIARGGFHLQVFQSKDGMLYLKENEEPPVRGLRPCADNTLDSISHCSIQNIVCAVLTGMGTDGCAGIQKIKENGNVFTIAQDEESCVIYGMPRAIVDKGLADISLPLDEIPKMINIKVGVHYDGFKSIS